MREEEIRREGEREIDYLSADIESSKIPENE